MPRQVQYQFVPFKAVGKSQEKIIHEDQFVPISSQSPVRSTYRTVRPVTCRRKIVIKK